MLWGPDRERLVGELGSAELRHVPIEVQRRLRRYPHPDSGRASFEYQFAAQAVQTRSDWPPEDLVRLFAAAVREPGKYWLTPGGSELEGDSTLVIPLAAAEQVPPTLPDAPVSTGFAGGLVKRVAARLVGFEVALKDWLRAAPVMHHDETPARVAGDDADRLLYIYIALARNSSGYFFGATKQRTPFSSSRA